MNQESDREIHQAIGEAVARAEDASAAADLAEAVSVDPPAPVFSIYDLKFALSELEHRKERAEAARQEYDAAVSRVYEQEQRAGEIFEQLKKSETLKGYDFVIKQSYDIIEVNVRTSQGFGTLQYHFHMKKLEVL